jgi:hypothetical protein
VDVKRKAGSITDAPDEPIEPRSSLSDAIGVGIAATEWPLFIHRLAFSVSPAHMAAIGAAILPNRRLWMLFGFNDVKMRRQVSDSPSG